MAATHLLKARVSLQMKERVHALAEREHLNESIWLRRLIATTLESVSKASTDVPRASQSSTITDVLADPVGPITNRVCVRLRPEDRRLLRERSAARGLASATYVSVLVRAHLRHLTPLPKEELKALKGCVAELSAIGRLLSQIARAPHQGQSVVIEHLHLMLKRCESLRDHIKRLISRNVKSWEVGS